jgi:hypothetical protein
VHRLDDEEEHGSGDSQELDRVRDEGPVAEEGIALLGTS